MKSKPWTVLLLAFLLCSCASLTPDRIAVLAAIAGNAAQIGAAAWLKEHPEHIGAFQAIVDALSGLQSVGASAKAYTENARGRRLTLHDLPTTTLASKEGAVYLSDGVVRVWDERTQKSYDGSPEPVRKAIVSGLKRALMPVPPVPVQVRKRNPYTLELNPGVATNNAYPPGWQTNVGLRILPPPPPMDTNAGGTFLVTGPALRLMTNESASVTVVESPTAPTTRTRREAVYAAERRRGTNWIVEQSFTNATPAEWRIRRVR